MSFIVIDGPNGGGKTSIIKKFTDQGYDTLSSPNGTPLAQFLRPVCRGTDPWVGVDKTVQFLCFSAARLSEYIERVHNKNHTVIADRWWTSTYAYQVILGGLPQQFLEYTIHPQEKIDMVFLLNGDPEVLIERVVKEREKNPSHGICSWTKEKDTMRRISQIYSNELPEYLKHEDIKCIQMDTTNWTIDKTEIEIKNALHLNNIELVKPTSTSK